VICNLLSIFTVQIALAQEKSVVSGYVKDSSTGEVLIGATVYAKGTTIGTTTNSYGFYSLNLPKGSYTLIYSNISYNDAVKDVDLSKGIQLNVELQPSSVQNWRGLLLAAIKLTPTFTRPEMSMVKLEMKKIRQIPALMGEADVIKSIHYCPVLLVR
jgi:hypothetical protein